jgi:hypothetical protein
MAETTSLSDEVRSGSLPTEAPPTPMSQFATRVTKSDALIPDLMAAGAQTEADLRAKAARGRTEAEGVEKAQGEQTQAAAASRAKVDEARQKADAQPSLDTQARPFLMPGKDFLAQIQTAILGATQMALGAGGLKGGGHAIAAVAGLKGALEGWQHGDNERAQAALRDWKAAAAKLHEDFRNRLELHRDLLTDQKTTMDNRLALIGMRAAADGDTVAADLAHQGNIKGLIEHWDKQDQITSQFALTTRGLDQSATQHYERIKEDQRNHDMQDARARDIAAIHAKARADATKQAAEDRALLDRAAHWTNAKGQHPDPLLSPVEAVKQGFYPFQGKEPKEVSVPTSIAAVDQVLGMIPALKDKGLLMSGPGLRPFLSTEFQRRVWQIGDEDLTAFTSHTSTLIRTVRELGDIGFRAQAAIRGTTDLIEKATTSEGLDKSLKQLRNLLVMVAPSTISRRLRVLDTRTNKYVDVTLEPGETLNDVPEYMDPNR